MLYQVTLGTRVDGARGAATVLVDVAPRNYPTARRAAATAVLADLTRDNPGAQVAVLVTGAKIERIGA